MFSTIEPRLISLFVPPSLELPPLHGPSILHASRHPLTLEPKKGGIEHVDSSDTFDRPCFVEHNNLPSTQQSAHAQSTSDEDWSAGQYQARKRGSHEISKDDLLHLPQPLKKQKTLAQKQIVPPIIIPLFEPPPQATWFPPIAEDLSHECHDRGYAKAFVVDDVALDVVVPAHQGESLENQISTYQTSPVEECNPVPKKATKPRRKWSQDETQNLLFGVQKHGVGRWRDILEDSAFVFDDRSTVDLKDRFRTCFPPDPSAKERSRARSTMVEQTDKSAADTSQAAKDLTMPKKCRSVDVPDAPIALRSQQMTGMALRSRRAKERHQNNLTRLGIDQPFRKSPRRERRPFTAEDDVQILSGYRKHGTAWSRILQDPAFRLQHRKPTDLRDRLRNKHPELFANGSAQLSSGATVSHNTHVPTRLCVTVSPDSHSHARSSGPSGVESLDVSTLNTDDIRSNSYKEIVNPSTSHALHQPVSASAFSFNTAFDWTEPSSAPFVSSLNDMDISRLLLDESWVESATARLATKQRHAYTDINSILASTPHTQQCDSEMLINLLDDQVLSSTDETLTAPTS